MLSSKCIYLHSCVRKCSSCSCLQSAVLRNTSNTVTKTKKIDIILVQYKAIYIVVKRSALGGKKRKIKKCDEKYPDPGRVDEWTFINAAAVGRGVSEPA